MSELDRVLITGGGGMLAQALRFDLARRSHASICLDRAACDITDPAAVERAVDTHRPTLVLNCAAHTKVDLCEQEPERADEINGQAVGRLARLCREREAMLVHVSTDFVFDGHANHPYREDDAPSPLSAYGRSKLLGERLLVENAPPKWMLVRTAWVFGPGGANFPRTRVTLARQGKPLSVVDDQIGGPTYTPDLARAMLDLIERGGQGIYHLTNSGQTSWFEFAAATLDAFSARTNLTPTSTRAFFENRPKAAPRPAYSVLDCSRAAQLLGHPMRPWRDALADYAAAEQREGF
jgi:dTDP-4-dehydrorhamnose reductase